MYEDLYFMGKAKGKGVVIITLLENVTPTKFSVLDYVHLVKELKKLGGLL